MMKTILRACLKHRVSPSRNVKEGEQRRRLSNAEIGERAHHIRVFPLRKKGEQRKRLSNAEIGLFKQALTFILMVLVEWAVTQSACAEIRNKAFYALMDQERRPTVEQILALFEGHEMPADNPFISYSDPLFDHPFGQSGRSVRRFVQAFSQAGPQIIAQLEFAYPQGIYAALGRDAAMVGDFLNAFYLSIGEKGRAMLLEASGPTIREATDSGLIDWIKGYGFDFSNPDQIRQKPSLTILDTSRYSVKSQSTRILRTLFNSYKERGGNLEDIWAKVNFVNIFAASGFLSIASFANPKGLHEALKFDSQLEIPGRALSLSFKNSPSLPLTHGAEWHASFGGLRKVNERTVAQPGIRENPDERRAVAAQIFEMIKMVNHPEFLGKVKQAARKFNYEFLTPHLPTINASRGCGQTFKEVGT